MPPFILIGLTVWNAVSKIWGWIRGISGAVKTAINILGRSVQTIGQWGITFAKQTGVFFKDLVGLFRRFWTSTLKPALSWLDDKLRLIQRKLHDWLDPVVTRLIKIRAWLLEHYNKYIRPVLDTIDVTRRILRVLGSLGLDWAKRLDRKLAKIEDAIETPFLYLMGKINELIGWVNRVIDADGLFQRVTLLRTMFRYRTQLTNFSINSVVKPLTPEQRKKLDDPVGEYDPSYHASELVDANLHHSGKLYQRADEEGKDLARLMLNGGVFFPPTS